MFTTPTYCREIAAAIPSSQFTTIRNADHLFHIERFDATLELLDRFVNGRSLNDHDGINPAETFGSARAGMSLRSLKQAVVDR